MPCRKFAAGARELQLMRCRARGNGTLCITIATTLLDPLLYPARRRSPGSCTASAGRRRPTSPSSRQYAEDAEAQEQRPPRGVKKELAVYAAVYNLVHAVMLRAAQRQGVALERISFIDTLRCLLGAEPGAELPDLLVNPHRPDRHEPGGGRPRGHLPSQDDPPAVRVAKSLKNTAKATLKAMACRWENAVLSRSREPTCGMQELQAYRKNRHR